MKARLVGGKLNQKTFLIRQGCTLKLPLVSSTPRMDFMPRIHALGSFLGYWRRPRTTRL